MLTRLFLTLLTIAMVLGGIYTLKQQQSAGRARALSGGPPPATVTATTVETLGWARRIETVGDLAAIQDVAIASEVPGKVVEIRFTSGAAVPAGEVLVRLDASEDRAQLAALQAELELAQLENERIRQLSGSAAFSQSNLDRAQSQVANLRAQVERQRVRVDRKVVRAPFAGVLGIRQVSLGDILAAGDQVVRLQSLDPIYVDVTVPERHRGAVAPGQTLQLSVAAWPGETFTGELLVVSPDVDLRSRTLTLRGQLDNADHRLQPGMFATVHLLLGDAEPVLTVPRAAIAFRAFGESVFVIDSEAGREVVHRRLVRVGRTRDERVEIIEGLAAGERIVHTGHLKLREGQAVEIVDGPALPEGVTDL